MTLTVLCVTAAWPYARPFIQAMRAQAHCLEAGFVLAVDLERAHWPAWIEQDAIEVRSAGYLESVLDQAVAYCPDGHILRLDDDERLTPQMVDWLASREYEEHDHWAFPRLNLWPDRARHVTNPPLWPDLQTRLSVKAKSAGRHRVHAGSPHGTGRVAPVAIEHHKFLVRTRAEREQLMADYEQLQEGAGRDYAMFSVPELYDQLLQTAPVDEAMAVAA